MTNKLVHNKVRHHTNLTKIHDNALMNLLPQVSPEDLDEGDLQSGDLAVHENSRQVKLHLETDVHLRQRRIHVSLLVISPSSGITRYLVRDT